MIGATTTKTRTGAKKMINFIRPSQTSDPVGFEDSFCAGPGALQVPRVWSPGEVVKVFSNRRSGGASAAGNCGI